MKTSVFVVAIVLVSVNLATGQKYKATKGFVSFFSTTPVEDIKAVNNAVGSLLNTETGDLVFSINISDFQFEQSLMKEHFNEKYMETEKYPKARFVGKLSALRNDVAIAQEVKATGKMTMHGVTRDIEVTGTLQKTGDAWVMKAKFPVRLKDYQIEIPKLLWEKIAEVVDVTVDLSYSPQ